jgi:uncharacterized OB-fold protein
MSSGIPVQVCARCRRRFFPSRFACSTCGCRHFEIESVSEGRVEETTTLRRQPGGALPEPVVLTTIRLADGPRVIARLDSKMPAGTAVQVRIENGAPVGRGI